ncbi:hypothetical protein D3C86_1832450 [compost metagenome]
MSYMLTVAMAFMRGSILAALITKLPLPHTPMAPMRCASTKAWLPRKSTAALKLSAYRSGDTALRGWPSLPPQKGKSSDRVT